MFNGQNNNTVGGHLVGGNFSITNINPPPLNKPTQIGYLYERLKLEINCDKSKQDFVEELKHYMDCSTSGIQRTLSQKLIDSGRINVVNYAEDLKQTAAMRIMRFQSSLAAQEIFAYILGELHSKYILLIFPLIAAGENRVTIDAAIDREVISPIVQSMEPSALQMTPRLILALLFYLAGNCHIQWDNDAYLPSRL